MKQQSHQFNFDCEFRCGNTSPSICKYQSLRLGHIVKTSYLFCNNSCPKKVYLNGEEDNNFLKECFNRRYDINFIQEVINKYKKQTTIIIPKNWQTIYNTFFPLLSQYSWFNDIGLTGSCIVEGVTNHKDIDVVIYINNIDDYITWQNNNTLPSHIDNTKIDYYIYVNPYCQFFVSVWPNSKSVIINKNFENNVKIPVGYSVSYNNFDFEQYLN